MLCVNNYTQKYIDDCRAKVELQLAAYNNLITTARKQASSDKTVLEPAIKAFEHNFFRHMVLAMDNYFCHRSRTIEKKTAIH